MALLAGVFSDISNLGTKSASHNQLCWPTGGSEHGPAASDLVGRTAQIAVGGQTLIPADCFEGCVSEEVHAPSSAAL